MIYIQRVYENDPALKGKRFLVDRVWPRGLKKDEIDAVWTKDVGPSHATRKRFHDSGNREEFKQSYFKELDADFTPWSAIIDSARQGDIVLLYGSRDIRHNNALALKEYLDNKLAQE